MNEEKIRKARENIESVLTTATLTDDEITLLDEAEEILVELLNE